MPNVQKKIEEEKPYASFDTCDIYDDEVGYLLERAKDDGEELTEDDARKQAYDDYDILSRAYDDLCEYLTELMKEINPDGAWYATMENFGWRNQSGSKKFRAETGKELLNNILPKTDCNFWIYKRNDAGRDYIAINNTHHDSPVRGKEFYYIYKADTCESCGEILDEDNKKKVLDGGYVCEDCARNYYDDSEIYNGKDEI